MNSSVLYAGFLSKKVAFDRKTLEAIVENKMAVLRGVVYEHARQLLLHPERATTPAEAEFLAAVKDLHRSQREIMMVLKVTFPKDVQERATFKKLLKSEWFLDADGFANDLAGKKLGLTEAIKGAGDDPVKKLLKALQDETLKTTSESGFKPNDMPEIQETMDELEALRNTLKNRVNKN